VIIQIDSTKIINTDNIECISKITDNKVSISFVSGDSIYVHKSFKEVMSLISNPCTELLNEWYPWNS
jgi:uncharacterized protein YlzI (FlbEa/FlbD family)